MKKIVVFLPAIFLMIIIYLFSAAPATQSSELSDGISYRIVQQVGKLPLLQWDENQVIHVAERIHTPIRKMAHFSEYALLGICWVLPLGLYMIKKGKSYGAALVLCFLYACTDEIHQLFVVGRDGNVRDVMIDTAGALVGILLVWGWRHLSPSRVCVREKASAKG